MIVSFDNDYTLGEQYLFITPCNRKVRRVGRARERTNKLISLF